MRFPRLCLTAVVALALPCAHALEWEKTLLDLKPQPGADVVLATYNFKNPRPASVHILGITTSCGCTEAQPSASEIRGGQSGSIQVVFTIGQRSGRQEKEILVQTDEAKEPVKLVLRVDLPPARQGSATP